MFINYTIYIVYLNIVYGKKVLLFASETVSKQSFVHHPRLTYIEKETFLLRAQHV